MKRYHCHQQIEVLKKKRMQRTVKTAKMIWKDVTEMILYVIMINRTEENNVKKKEGKL